ncbi:MAG TPA: hypothetical protein PLQ56_09610 [Aggregatilineales bacterium]|nr:hypothetical protein [Aggregatilineales bacterium]
MPELILAQIDSGIGDFFAQPFVSTALAAICLLGLLLVGVVILLVYLRSRGIGLLGGTRTPAAAAPADEADMPELAALVSPTPAPADYAPVRALRKGTFTVTPADGAATEAVEVLTVLRDVVDGRLLVQIGDKTLLNPAQDSVFNERLQKVLRELAVSDTNPPAPPVQIPVVPPLVAPVVQASEEEALPLPESLLPPVSTPRSASSANRAPAPGVLPSFKLDDVPLERPQRGKKYTPKPVPELNIASAIETFIQFKLANLGLFPGRSIHVLPAPDGGVRIEVDGQSFDAVGDVSDIAVREFLAASVQEWQDQH